jgi:UDP-N-acetylmuramoyl-tripeptide--D-alanyl-D-alanine ligase
MARVRHFPGTTVTFGYAPGADVRAVEVEDLGLAGMRARLVAGDRDCPIRTSLLGRGNLANLIAAAAVALRFEVSLEAIAASAETLKPAHRRGSVHAAHGITVVDDSYNSSPAALRRTLDVLRRESAYPRKLAVLGEMLELGAFADALHRSCGEDAATAGLAALVAVGGEPARALAEGAVSAGMNAASVHYVATSVAAADLVASLVRAGDVVLVKGSRGIRTDVVVDRLVEGAA